MHFGRYWLACIPPPVTMIVILNNIGNGQSVLVFFLLFPLSLASHKVIETKYGNWLNSS